METLNVAIRLDLGRIPTDIKDPALYRELLRIHDAIERLAVGFTETGPGGPLAPVVDHSDLLGLNGDDHPQYHNNSRGDARYVNLAGDTMTGDLDMNGKNILTAGIAHNFTAGENLTAGDICYLDTAGKMSKAHATDATTCSTLIAVSLGSPLTGISGDFLLHGICTGAVHGFSTGDKIYVGLTPGAKSNSIPVTAGQIVRVIGYAINSTQIYLEPDKTWLELG